MSIRDKFRALARAGGKRKDFFKLAKAEGLTDKETLAKKTKIILRQKLLQLLLN
jgi:hypothetical protein